MDTNEEAVCGVFMFEWQLQLVLAGLAYWASRDDGLTLDEVSDIDNLIEQIQASKMIEDAEGNLVSQYVEELDGKLH